MTYYSYFNPVAYVKSYQDVASSVNAPRGFLPFEHFSLYGLNEGRTQASYYWNENGYLALNPDVANAVKAGTLKSGLQHFSDIGVNEGRYSPIGALDSEQVYLKLNPDVAQAVKSGAFKSGYQHFLQNGLAEGRTPSYMNQGDYLIQNPDVAAAIGKPYIVPNIPDQQVIYSAFDHYTKFGQYENRPVLFSGTSGNDNVTAFYQGSGKLTGVAYQTVSKTDYKLLSTGVNEIDSLTGLSVKGDRFILGTPISPSNPKAVQLYVGNGNADYAIIRNFRKGLDTIQLAGSISNYTQVVNGGDLLISAINNGVSDLVARVQGLTTTLTTVSGSTNGTFLAG